MDLDLLDDMKRRLAKAHPVPQPTDDPEWQYQRQLQWEEDVRTVGDAFGVDMLLDTLNLVKGIG